MPDAIVIGAGPNGLVAANLLADAGWSVEVLEAEARPGGAVKSSEHVEPEFVHDEFSSFYPLAIASPVVRALELERYGLRWRHGPLVLAHPTEDETCTVLSRNLDETAASLDSFAAGDGDAWRTLFARYRRIEEPLLQALMTPFPPVRAGLRIAFRMWNELPELARFALLPVRRLADEHFRGVGAARLLAGNALHADFAPESTLGGFFGWFLSSLGQGVGYPFPEGGAGKLTESLVRRLEAKGGRVTCDARVHEIVVRNRRAVGVRSKAGDATARRAVLANVHAVALYLDLLARKHVPARVLDAIGKLELDPATLKVDWTLDGPIPWTAPDARRAPVIHVAESIDELTVTASELARRLVPSNPFLVLGQYSMGDPSRQPEGKETAWAYTHLPQGVEPGDLAERMEARVEALAPGFRALIRKRHAWTPELLERANENLLGGALNGGTAQLHQQLIFRPVPGLGRAETPVRGLYLCSSSAHPGGGVHGGPGAIAARTALRNPR
ncbi:MAG: NAD(P)/FAD-dependent oxidoreductase [Gaiellaceae bacterium MAG52_C11]|nr:NAD(P)/FAD-dependent oxidoreductase [Candidatus Gaiellasilicea maunaloa]